MRRHALLNGLLTLNAILMAGVLWTQLSDRPIFAGKATAGPADPALAPSIPNAADQRQKIVDELRGIKASMESLKQSIQGGTYKVEVTNFSAMNAANDKKN
ncbi:MAG TPA: hypothetical protein VG711_09140 [Phycisphaerales bacterium]|nr:hypothetical protein [Phycisphaerales bacterium]